VSLKEALELVVLYAHEDSPKFEQAAVRWLARYRRALNSPMYSTTLDCVLASRPTREGHTVNMIRRGAAVVQRYLVTLYFLGVVAQFFLVGYGLFGMKKGDTIDNAHSLNAHRDFGWALTQFGGLALLLTTLIAWQKPLRRWVVPYVVLCLLGFPLQPLLAAGGVHHRYVGLFHPVNAMLLLGLSGYLSYSAWATRRARGSAPEAASAASTP
jgi:hypothetical protein